MTEEAVRERFDGYIDSMYGYVTDEVQPLNAVGFPTFISKPTRKATLPVARRETDAVGRSFERKFGIVVDCAAGDDVTERTDDYLEADVFYANFQGAEEDRGRMSDELVDRLREMSEAVAPIVDSDEERFWDAVVDVYDREGAHSALDGCFDYARTAHRYADDVELTITLDIGPFGATVDYTDEAVRVLDVSEGRLREKVRKDVDAVYDAKQDG
ncbi:hypothetical protein EGH25_02880 [Haladaptatus sp. F3-133]|jgi:hypothetical protein|uniref:Uncharacterized protein n=1 Tax=Halorutilus salinus TaxID=2487751 RepID=A0A9Q4C4R5_9EURY|nr:hypothetical protein [Halorutilus salinus]MCX2818296.1 hypothetical protein [Halorutilus salinus]